MLRDFCDVITLNESGNDGKTVYLYFDEMVGMYAAYGLSAYYVTHIADGVMSYSDAMQMPVALLNKAEVKELRQSCELKAHQAKKIYRFETRQLIGRVGYDNWAERIRKRAEKAK